MYICAVRSYFSVQCKVIFLNPALTVGQAVTSTKTLLRRTDIKSILVEEKIMKTKIKRFSKSTVSILLSLMMLFSCVVTSGAVTVQPERTAVTLDDVSENAAVELDSTANADEQTTAQPVALENEKINADVQESGANVDIQRSGATKSGGTVIYYVHSPSSATYWNDASAVIRAQVRETSSWTESSLLTVYKYNDTYDYFIVPTGNWQQFKILRYSSDGNTYWNSSNWTNFEDSKNTVSDFGNKQNCTFTSTYTKPVSNSTINASSTSIVEEQTVTFTKSLTTNSDLNEIKSIVYNVTGGTEGTDYSKLGDIITFYNAGIYDVSATVTYYAKGFSSATTDTTTNTIRITVTANSGYLYTINQTGGTVSDVKVNGVADNTGAANENDVITFKVTPPEGCVAKVEADDGTNNTLLTPTNGTYSYTMPAANVTINITYSYTVYFYNALNWSTVKVYAWDSSQNLTGQWPGTALSNPTNNIYTVTLPSTAENVSWLRKKTARRPRRVCSPAATP